MGIVLNSFLAPLNSLRGPLKAPNFQNTLWQTKEIPFQKPQGTWSSMVNIGTYFDNPHSFMAPSNSLRGPLQEPDSQISLKN